MNERQMLAAQMREDGLTYEAIGQELGIKRQSAYALVKQAAALQKLSADKADTSGLTDVAAAPVSLFDGYDIPTTSTTRNVIAGEQQGGWTPSRYASMLLNAGGLTQTAAFFEFCEELEEKDANYRSVIGTRKRGVEALRHQVTPGIDNKLGREIAEFCATAYKRALADNLGDMLDAIAKGFSACEMLWLFENGKWVVDEVVHRPQKFFVFNRRDGETLYVASDTPGGQPVPLQPNKWLIHRPKLKSGIAIKNGLAIAAGWVFVLKWLAKRDWTSLNAVYGKPIKLGKYKPGTPAKMIQALRAAVAQIGSDSSAVIEEGMGIEFITAMQGTGSADVFEKFIRYCDEQVAKLVLGASLTSGTGNTGSGGSQALGSVHAGLLEDIVRSDARALARTIQRRFIKPLVEINFGPDAPMPVFEFLHNEPTDRSALASGAAQLAGIGVGLSKKALALEFGIPLAAEDEPEDAVSVPAAAAAVVAGGVEESNADTADTKQDAKPKAGSETAKHSASLSLSSVTAPDPILDLADESVSDWEAVTAEIDQAFADIAAQSTGFKDLRARHKSFAATGDVEKLRLYLTQQRVKARLAGLVGAAL